MRGRARSTRGLARGLVGGLVGWVLVAGAGCNALTGVDDYHLRADAGGDAADADAGEGQGHLVFVSSELVAPTFGGDGAGADEVCRRLGKAAGKPGSYVALVARDASGPDLKTRLGDIHGFVRADGAYLADTVDDLLAGRLHRPVLLDETRSSRKLDEVWTGFSVGGTPSKHCRFWSSTSNKEEGVYGVPEGGLYAAIDYLEGLGLGCNERAHVYCVQVDGTDRSPPAPVAGKIVFLTKTAAVSTAIATADALCQADADVLRTDKRKFRALVARVGVAAGAAIVPTAVYVRPSGVRIGTGKQLLEGSFDTGLWETADGAYARLSFTSWTWSGAVTLTDKGLGKDTCADWTSTSSLDLPQIGEPTSVGADWFHNPNANDGTSPINYHCSDSGRLYCVEE